MNKLNPQELSRVAIHLTALNEPANYGNILVTYKDRQYGFSKIEYHNRELYLHAYNLESGVLFKVALTHAQLATLALEILAQARVYDNVDKTWV